jgi:MraZ protein
VLFTGQFEHTVDAKGRLAIPAKYRALWNREQDGDAWYCVPWPEDRVLRLYTEKTYQSLASQWNQSLTPSQTQSRLQRGFFGLSERLEMDKQGRVILPRVHLDLVGLGPEVVVIGSLNRLEVVDRAKWLADLKQTFESLPQLAAGNDGRGAAQG